MNTRSDESQSSSSNSGQSALQAPMDLSDAFAGMESGYIQSVIMQATGINLPFLLTMQQQNQQALSQPNQFSSSSSSSAASLQQPTQLLASQPGSTHRHVSMLFATQQFERSEPACPQARTLAPIASVNTLSPAKQEKIAEEKPTKELIQKIASTFAINKISNQPLSRRYDVVRTQFDESLQTTMMSHLKAATDLPDELEKLFAESNDEKTSESDKTEKRHELLWNSEKVRLNLIIYLTSKLTSSWISKINWIMQPQKMNTEVMQKANPPISIAKYIENCYPQKNIPSQLALAIEATHAFAKSKKEHPNPAITISMLAFFIADQIDRPNPEIERPETLRARKRKLNFQATMEQSPVLTSIQEGSPSKKSRREQLFGLASSDKKTEASSTPASPSTFSLSSHLSNQTSLNASSSHATEPESDSEMDDAPSIEDDLHDIAQKVSAMAKDFKSNTQVVERSQKCILTLLAQNQRLTQQVADQKITINHLQQQLQHTQNASKTYSSYSPSSPRQFTQQQPTSLPSTPSDSCRFDSMLDFGKF